MKVDWSSPVRDLDDKPLGRSDTGQPKEVTIGEVAITALLGELPGEGIVDADEKYLRADLADRINSLMPPRSFRSDTKPNNNFTFKEIEKVREVIGKFAKPIAVKRCYDILDGANDAEGGDKETKAA